MFAYAEKRPEKRARPTIRQRYIKYLMGIALPLIAMLFLSTLYSIHANNKMIAASNRRMVDNWLDETQDSLNRIDLFLSNLFLNEQESEILAIPSKPDSALQALQSLCDRFDTALLSFPALTSLACSSDDNDLFAARFSGTAAIGYAERENLRAFARDSFENVSTHSWTPESIEGKSYLVRFFRRDGAHLAAVIDLENLAPHFIDDRVNIVYRSQADGSVLTGADFVEAAGIRFSDHADYSITGADARYMILEAPFDEVGLTMVFILDEQSFWNGLDGVQIAFLLLSVLMIALVLLLYSRVNRWLNKPIEQLTADMVHIKQGEPHRRIEADFDTHELMQLRDAFNDMMQEIQSLKIDAYEREIQRQQMQLQYLYRQIRPHFFLNCLKSLYACAQQQKTEQMQQMILSISKHIRYWFEDDRTTVTLEEEMHYALNYLKIQQLCLVPPPTFEVSADPALNACRIPPFTIQTFVENAVKHEWNPGSVLHIAIKAARILDDGKPYLNVTVTDNGDGFPEEMLDALNNPEFEPNARNHIGLNNIKHRLQLIYGGEALMAFYNHGGSCAELLLPYTEEVDA